jgi:Concanavalin A-like lectin/glucanases superfamily
MTSVYDNSAYATVRKDLHAELARLQQQLDDTQPEVPLRELRRRALLKSHPLTAVALQSVLRKETPDGPVPRIDPSWKPFTVGATCVPHAPDGVLIADGGVSEGFSLYLHDGKPHFAVRSAGQLFQVIATDALPLNQSVNLVGVLAPDATLRLFVNGKPVGTAPGQPISRMPADGLSLGQDSGSFVGEYSAPLQFHGELRDLRIYWGALDDAALRQWVGAR